LVQIVLTDSFGSSTTYSCRITIVAVAETITNSTANSSYNGNITVVDDSKDKSQSAPKIVSDTLKASITTIT
jgi:hypothetical protein